MAVPSKRKRWAGPAAEAALVLVVLFLLLVSGLTGYVVGRETANDDASKAVTTTAEGGTTEAATTETTTEATTGATTGATTETGSEATADGAEVFANAGCGSCHTFSKAGSTGQVGPPLDDTKLNKNEIEQKVRNGGGAMPAFGDRLSDTELEAVAEYVAGG